jgi:hypothetical protein
MSMAIGARTDNATDMLKKLLGELSNIMTAPDADVDFLKQLHDGIITKLREPVDIGYATGQLGGGPGQGMSPGPQSATAMGGFMAGPSSAGGAPMSALAALMGGGAPGGNLTPGRPQPSADELRRVLRKVA